MQLGEAGILAGSVYAARKGNLGARNGQDLPLNRVKPRGWGITEFQALEAEVSWWVLGTNLNWRWFKENIRIF